MPAKHKTRKKEYKKKRDRKEASHARKKNNLKSKKRKSETFDEVKTNEKEGTNVETENTAEKNLAIANDGLSVEEKPFENEEKEFEATFQIVPSHECKKYDITNPVLQDFKLVSNQRESNLNHQESNSFIDNVKQYKENQKTESRNTSPNVDQDCRKSQSALSELDGLFYSLTTGSSDKKIQDTIVKMCENVLLIPSNSALEQEYIHWILQKSASTKTNYCQSLCLCAVIGHLVDMKKGDLLTVELSDHTKSAFDKLLAHLHICQQKHTKIQEPVKSYLESGARTIVLGCSWPGWLTYAAYFKHFLGIKYILKTEFETNTHHYSEEEFLHLLTPLVYGIEHIKRVEHYEQPIYHQYLQRIMQYIPNYKALFLMSEYENIRRFFFSYPDRQNFFFNFYQTKFISDPGSLETKLNGFDELPISVREKLHYFIVNYILEFLKSTDYSLKEDNDAILNFLSKVSLDQFLDLLFFLSNSNELYQRDWFFRIICEESLQSSWEKIKSNDRYRLCKNWIDRMVDSGKNSLNRLGRFKALLLAVNSLLSCCKAFVDESFVSRLSKEIATDFYHESLFNILEDSKEFDDYSPLVKNLIADLILQKLKKSPNLLRNGEIIKYFSAKRSTSFQQRILEHIAKPVISGLETCLIYCILDVLHELRVKWLENKTCNNDVLTEALQYCEVWVELLTLKEVFSSTDAFQEWVKLWQYVEECIMSEDITVSFLIKIERYKKHLFSIFSALRRDDDQVRKNCLLHTARLFRTEKELRKNVELLLEAEKFSQNVLPRPGWELKESISDCHVNSLKIKEVNDDFWKPYRPLLKQLEPIKMLLNSVSFSRIAKIVVKETVDFDRQNMTIDRDLQICLFQVLTKQGVDRFTAEWQQIFQNISDITIGQMKNVLGDLDPLKLDDELFRLESYFEEKFSSHVKIYVNDYTKFPRVLKQAMHVTNLLNAFGIHDFTQSAKISRLMEFCSMFDGDEDKIVIKTFHTLIEQVEYIISLYDIDNTDKVMIELGDAPELIKFICEIVDEDIRVLIDAVEEHSDEAVQASVVSDLIQVHGFLAPIIKKRDFPPDLILTALVDTCKKQTKMAEKIHYCSEYVHSLRGLYQNLANREEMTREIIKHCLANGVFNIKLDSSGSCQITMIYQKEKNKIVVKSMDDLQDLRSRAHLILSSEQIPENLTEIKTKDAVNFYAFIEQVNLLSEIEEAIINLQSSGYVKYQKDCEWESLSGTKDLEETMSQLSNDFKDWQQSLSEARKHHYFLNYFWSDQLSVIFNFISRENSSENDVQNVVTLMKFVDPTINAKRLRNFQSFCVVDKFGSPLEIVEAIGSALNDIFSDVRPTLSSRKIFNDIIHPKPNLSVHNGELYIVALEKDSVKTVNVMLSLYENTTNAFPEPHQVLFCNETTPWEQLHIFLSRCFNLSKNPACNSLFCLSNVELLSNEVQFNLVDYIKKKEFEDCEQNYLLAIICRGGAHHHIIEEFSKFVHHISGMSYPEIARRFKSKWPHVKCVASTLQGLGKTEYIRKEAFRESLNVVSFPITGKMNESKVIKRLKNLRLRDFNCLHFDISNVENPMLLDTFLFQLIVTGMVSCGTQMYNLQNKKIYIEIANSFNNQLVNSLVITRCFPSIELTWNDYNDLQVSSQITSNVQVVCQYLNVYENGEIDETDIHFAGPEKVKPLSKERCRELLRIYYGTNKDIAFTSVYTFLGFFADQLRKFSKSAFFKVNNLKLMLENNALGLRKNLLETLLVVSKDFSSRSLSSHAQRTSSSSHDQNIVQRMEGMIQWEQSNHLLIVFQSVDSQTIAAFYREKSKVPLNISKLLESQMKDLVDFKSLRPSELHQMLEKIARTRLCQEITAKTTTFSNYVLTPDNLLKMILIILRVRAKIPIIIMGETGCGKTSLVKYLASTCEIPFSIYNFHAGRTEDEITEFIEKESARARMDNSQRWIFLDEINTCHHLGLINEIMCHHTLLGRPISRKLVFIAACNPYKLRSLESSSTAGLEGKKVDDEYSKLVYRVHPLPESMVDYVWDYGSLTPQDEKVYIERMVNEFPGEYQHVLTELLALSQCFIRKSEKNPFCVSLRDVQRCILLVKWFIVTLKEQKKLMEERKRKGKSTLPFPFNLRKYESRSKKYDSCPVVKSIVLALAHCYLSRLLRDDLRREYIQSLTRSLASIDVDKKSFKAIMRMEQENYLLRMELPEGTARNAALRENVFIMLVSILNRIPVFVVGNPGCSKSLAIQLIRSNLRGKDSKDAFFKTLPHLYVVSYQGSESSTSEGIEEIFKKASNYKEHNKSNNVLPVVLLDEVGLAENSPNNPLKVLHSILEPGKGELPEVAVVGISNWALDAAKMNRAIHLSRPEPSVKDLSETAISLYQGENVIDESTENVLRCLAEAYYDYRANQSHSNFHGLRDYYSLVKSLKGGRCPDMENINIALKRNFGGIPEETSNVQEIFNRELKSEVLNSKTENKIQVTRLIQENLNDVKARHLMLISIGDSAIGILRQHVFQSTKETITIFGSHFEEDVSDDYNYRMLSRIILCMERNCILILRDLECIYGSLYDMLNQNYSVVGGRKNCRVALGANSNPMCYVNDGFRCIVLVDHDQVDYSDPPFLNRFEKQLLRFSDMLNETQHEIMKELESWVHQMSSVEGFRDKFKEKDMFIGFNEDTLPSLVLYHSHNSDESMEVVLRKCKDDLMWIATPDGVLRLSKCNYYKEDPQEVESISYEYFRKPVHGGLASFISHVVEHLFYDAESEACSITLLMTHASVHTDISHCFPMKKMSFQLERLGAYKSGKQLEDRIHIFFTSDKELLIIQCKPELDAEHMPLTRSIVEEKRNAFTKKFREARSTMQRKHVCMIVHVRRASHENTPRWQLNFVSGWKQVFLDTLEVPSIPVNEIFDQSIDHLLSKSVCSFQELAVKCIMWCFNCLNYLHYSRQQESVLHIAKNLLTSNNVSMTIQHLVLKELSQSIDRSSENEREHWLVKVATDVELLCNSSNVSSAIEQYLLFLVRKPLAKLVYFLESENAWPPHLLYENVTEDKELWCDLIKDISIFDFKMIPDCQGTNSYSITGLRHDLKVPFSQVIAKKIQETRSFILKEYTKALENEENYEENGNFKKVALVEQLERYSNAFQSYAPCVILLSEYFASSYMADMWDIISANFHEKINVEIRIPLVMCVFLSFAKPWCPLKENDPIKFYALLHLFLWKCKKEISQHLQLIAGFLELNFTLNSLSQSLQDFFNDNKDILPIIYVSDERLCRNYFEEKDDGINTSDDDFSDSEYSSSGEEIDGDEVSESDDSEDEESEEDEEESFEEYLVTSICEYMFPSERSIHKNGGLDNWIRNSRLLLLLSSKVCNAAPAYHFLRLCVNFGEVVQQSGIPEEKLYIFTEIGTELDPEYLDDDNSLLVIKEKLLDDVEHLMRGNEKNQNILHKFMSQYYSRHVEAKMERTSSRPIIEYVFSLNDQDIRIMTPVLYRLLYIEEALYPGTYIDIVLDKTIGENKCLIKDVDDILKERSNDLSIHYDSHAAVIICDLIHSIQCFDEHFSIEKVNDHGSDLMSCFRSATSAVTGINDNFGIVFLSSVAFLRGFFTMLSEEPDILTYETEYSNILSEINSLLDGDDERRSSIRLYFLKQLYASGMTMSDLQKLCCESSQLPVMKNMFEKNCNFVKFEFFSATRMDRHKEVRESLLLQGKGNDGKLDGVLRKCENSSKYRLALMGLIINNFYVKRETGNLNDNEEKMARKLYQKVKRFPNHLKQLVSKLLGLEKFNHHGLQVSSESSTEQFDIALLILHVLCVVLSSDGIENSPLLQYVINQKNFHPTTLLGHGEKHRMLDQYRYVKHASFKNCLCKLHLQYYGQLEKCPNCGTEVDVNDHGDSIYDETLKSYFDSTKNKDWETCTVNMEPSVYRALHLIVNACFYGGIAAGLSSNEAILKTRFPENENGSFADACLNQINEDLKCLQTILSCKRQTAIDVMQLVVEESTPLLQGITLSGNTVISETECVQWENSFADMASNVFSEFLGSSRALKLKLEDHLHLQNEILELDEYPDDYEERNLKLKKLFRVTKKGSVPELRTKFFNSSKKNQKQHLVLSLFLSWFDELPYLTNLYPLINWTRYVISTLTHRISRKKVQICPISDLIDGVFQQEGMEEKEERKTMFQKFKVAWNKMHKIVNQHLDENQEEMPYIGEDTPIGYCLLDGDLSVYLKTAIKILQSMQNSFLDSMVAISLRTKHPAVSFLSKSENCCGVMSISLQDVKEKDIINMEWSNKYLRYTQNPEYGCGEDIDYDFEQIENILTNEVVLGKLYLTDISSTFIFSHELFHSCANILMKIRELCPQTPTLPKDLCQGVENLKEHRKQDARNLLQNIEIIIYLLHSGPCPGTKSIEEIENMELVEFADRFKDKLPRPFPVDLLPEPKKSIHLTHIAALYEELEDVLADGTIEGLPIQFRDDLDDVAKKLDNLIHHKNGTIKSKELLKVLRRFVFRYLSAEKFLPSAETPLRKCLRQPSLWTQETPPDEDLISEELVLGNIFAIIQHLQLV
ncbi:uncharacterized protein LOC124447744 isoform X2 [Xenia sp. Carnegie-2017]|uniref:uncharacterized protein LOC124447744 isoform X2 n=1 Tax=Xenia sp. Carnegie-2017 TaxID=2897299 RepID=UPI001F0448C8|nr:uncharacterized protein LOC124447744 isoform X2 [Xenia sp. Carnegie-2017]